MKIKVIKENDILPEGSVFELRKETENCYYGLWASTFGSYEIRINKKYCEEIK